MVKTKKSFIAKVFFNQKFFALVGFLIIILISFPLAKNISRRYKINQEVKELEREIAGLEKKNIDLKGLAAYLSSDQYVEEQARLNLGLKKPGEEVAVIKDNLGQENNQGGATTSAIFNIPGLKNVQPVRPESNAQKWLKYFLNNNF